MLTIRPVCWSDDAASLAELDTSFTTDRIYRVIGGDLGYTLVEERVDPPLRKSYGLVSETDNGSIRRMDYVAVAVEDGTVAGIAGAEVERWSRRLAVRHVYVGTCFRGRGLGRALIQELEKFGQSAGARCLWVETPSIDYPAIQFYRRVGFRFCGLDESLYHPSEVARAEVALFFVRDLADPSVALPHSG